MISDQQQGDEIRVEALQKSLLHFMGVSGAGLEDRVRPLHDWVGLRRGEGVWPYQRVLTSSVGGEVTVASTDGAGSRRFLNFGSQDYLGLARHPRISEAGKAAIDEFGVHSAGSPAFAGRTQIALDVQEALARTFEKESCLIYATGWAAGCGVITGLARSTDTVVIDQLGHNCLQEGIRLCGAETKRFGHNDPEVLEEILRSEREKDAAKGIFVVLESLYSMDSDSPDLSVILPICQRYGAMTILDVAHDFGCLGERGLGVLESLTTDVRPDIIMGSFSKTFASNGGFVACSKPVYDYLLCFSSPFMFSNAISPVQSAVVREALKIVCSDEGRQLRRALMDRIMAFRSRAVELGVHVGGTPSAICPVFVGREELARATSRYIAELRLLANLVEFPAVPRGQARFRFQLMSTHTFGAIDRALDILVEARDRASLGLLQ
jgi:7-keto-8-aminopelargonate synthetase-like enzyme